MGSRLAAIGWSQARRRSVSGLTVTTPDRTALDLGRLIPGDQAVARLDALGNATQFDASAAVIDLAGAAPPDHPVCPDCFPCSIYMTPELNRPGNRGCGCFSSAPAFRGPAHRFPYWMISAAPAISSTWVGRT